MAAPRSPSISSHTSPRILDARRGSYNDAAIRNTNTTANAAAPPTRERERSSFSFASKTKSVIKAALTSAGNKLTSAGTGTGSTPTLTTTTASSPTPSTSSTAGLPPQSLTDLPPAYTPLDPRSSSSSSSTSALPRPAPQLSSPSSSPTTAVFPPRLELNTHHSFSSASQQQVPEQLERPLFSPVQWSPSFSSSASSALPSPAIANPTASTSTATRPALDPLANKIAQKAIDTPALSLHQETRSPTSPELIEHLHDQSEPESARRGSASHASAIAVGAAGLGLGIGALASARRGSLGLDEEVDSADAVAAVAAHAKGTTSVGANSQSAAGGAALTSASASDAGAGPAGVNRQDAVTPAPAPAVPQIAPILPAPALLPAFAPLPAQESTTDAATSTATTTTTTTTNDTRQSRKAMRHVPRLNSSHGRPASRSPAAVAATAAAAEGRRRRSSSSSVNMDSDVGGVEPSVDAPFFTPSTSTFSTPGAAIAQQQQQGDTTSSRRRHQRVGIATSSSTSASAAGAGRPKQQRVRPRQDDGGEGEEEESQEESDENFTDATDDETSDEEEGNDSEEEAARRRRVEASALVPPPPSSIAGPASSSSSPSSSSLTRPRRPDEIALPPKPSFVQALSSSSPSSMSASGGGKTPALTAAAGTGTQAQAPVGWVTFANFALTPGTPASFSRSPSAGSGHTVAVGDQERGTGRTPMPFPRSSTLGVPVPGSGPAGAASGSASVAPGPSSSAAAGTDPDLPTARPTGNHEGASYFSLLPTPTPTGPNRIAGSTVSGRSAIIATAASALAGYERNAPPPSPSIITRSRAPSSTSLRSAASRPGTSGTAATAGGAGGPSLPPTPGGSGFVTLMPAGTGMAPRTPLAPALEAGLMPLSAADLAALPKALGLGKGKGRSKEVPVAGAGARTMSPSTSTVVEEVVVASPTVGTGTAASLAAPVPARGSSRTEGRSSTPSTDSVEYMNAEAMTTSTESTNRPAAAVHKTVLDSLRPPPTPKSVRPELYHQKSQSLMDLSSSLAGFRSSGSSRVLGSQQQQPGRPSIVAGLPPTSSDAHPLVADGLAGEQGGAADASARMSAATGSSGASSSTGSRRQAVAQGLKQAIPSFLLPDKDGKSSKDTASALLAASNSAAVVGGVSGSGLRAAPGGATAMGRELSSPETPGLQRRRSMYELRHEPPPYSVLLNRPEGLSQTILPREEEGRERLPPYKCAVHIEGYLSRKLEFSAPNVQAKDRSWKRQYFVLHGTSLRVYKNDYSHLSLSGKEAAWGMMEGVHVHSEPVGDEGMREQSATVIGGGSGGPGGGGGGGGAGGPGNGGSGAAITMNPTVRSGEKASWTEETTGGGGGGGSTQARRGSVANATMSAVRERDNSAGSGLGGGNFQQSYSSTSAANVYQARQTFSVTQEGKMGLVRHYSLQRAESGLAADYLKRKHIVRIRAEGEQFLLQTSSDRHVVNWIEALQAATNVALDLEVRPMPKFITLPRRRRRRRRETDATTTGVEHATAVAPTVPLEGETSRERAARLRRQEEADFAEAQRRSLADVSGVSSNGGPGVLGPSPSSTVRPDQSPRNDAMEEMLREEHEDWGRRTAAVM
ncbi:unnamed protein product [Tilletia controversa]|nr:unnamed protein product [Tilletia controversa]